MDNQLIQALTQYDAGLGTAWELSGDWLIVGDVHIPYTDWEFASLVARVGAKYLERPRLLIAGDYFSLDAFSNYLAVMTPPTWAQERDCARLLLKDWLSTFAEIRIILGNHDRRMQKYTEGMLDGEDLFAMVRSDPERVMVSNYSWCNITSGGELYRVTHPKSYSINRLTIASDLALKHDTHIISFHEHHLGISWDRFGRHVIVNGGALVDPSRLAYVSLEDSKSAEMVNGFVLLKNGTPYVFGKSPFTDWEAILG